jgi:DNA polymerase sigma
MGSKDLNTNIEDIQPYGSRVSGLNTYESDVDLNINYS